MFDNVFLIKYYLNSFLVSIKCLVLSNLLQEIMMEYVTGNKIRDLLIITPQVFEDKRGNFLEAFNQQRYDELIYFSKFVQDNECTSHKGVLRGLHFQRQPFAQGKLARVIVGSVLDVAVDVREGSPTFGQYETIILSGENKKQFWIPPGFAHGFLCLEDNTIFSFKCTNSYNELAEGGIRWNDPDVGIDWRLDEFGISKVIIKKRDQNWGDIKDLFKN